MTESTAAQRASKQADKECDSRVSGGEFPGNGAYRIAEAHQRDQVAGTGNGHRCNPRRNPGKRFR